MEFKVGLKEIWQFSLDELWTKNGSAFRNFIFQVLATEGLLMSLVWMNYGQKMDLISEISNFCWVRILAELFSRLYNYTLCGEIEKW